ncbi:hypothetical protein F3087_01030 [Nocardia colli]|uniref:Uncharacterized protein n=1 Tax=Nocardia colli TaxID=2545717 RepID=A0A5N0EKL0_9NOCA|nr:hypothetical protein [Nocardia colli]KAA8889938.1 hypothetical protein F3087_01030 [Nocardia colli]
MTAEREAPNGPGSKIRLHMSVDARIEDVDQLIGAAIESIKSTDFSDHAEQQTYLELVKSDPGAALVWLAVPDTIFGVPGVSIDSASWWQDRELEVMPSPDFEHLFPPCDCESDWDPASAVDYNDDDDTPPCEECGGWSLTPNTVACIHAGLDLILDMLRDDLEQLGDEPITNETRWKVLGFDRLPRTSWGMDRHWRERFIQACLDLQTDLAAGRRPEPRCNAEEIALHLAIEDAQVVEESGFASSYKVRRDDYEWYMCSSSLFQDHDVLMIDSIYTPGIDDPDDLANKFGGVGDLSPGNWFTWFNNVEPRSPKRLLSSRIGEPSGLE